jgi:hypothetical protein
VSKISAHGYFMSFLFYRDSETPALYKFDLFEPSDSS